MGMWYLGDKQILLNLSFYMFKSEIHKNFFIVKTKSSLSTSVFIFSTISEILKRNIFF